LDGMFQELELIDIDTRVNFEAEDSPMEGHVVVDADERTFEGGAGNIDGTDLQITGPSDVLAGMLTGSTDPVQGFMAGDEEGNVDLGMELASVIEGTYSEALGVVEYMGFVTSVHDRFNELKEKDLQKEIEERRKGYETKRIERGGAS